MGHSPFARTRLPSPYLSSASGTDASTLPLVGRCVAILPRSSIPMLNEKAQSADFNEERMELSEADK